MDERQKIFTIIPVYNEAMIIGQVIGEVLVKSNSKVIVVDDGSVDDSPKIAAAAGAIVVSHALNRGKGAAIKTGIEAAKQLGAEIVVAIDGDGQHNPAEINNLVEKINKGYDVVLGSRVYESKNMPIFKIIANSFGNFITWIFCGLWVSDSQSGFRAFSKNAIDEIETKADRYEFESEIIREINRKKLKYAEIPIEVRYTNYSMAKPHKQNIKNGIKTLYKILIKS